MGSSPSPAPPPPAPVTYPTPNPTPAPTCALADPTVPQLAVSIADMEDAGTGQDVYAAVYAGPNRQNRVWTDWRPLIHEGCNYLEAGNTAYFPQFEDITDAWLAVAFFNCGEDNAALTGIEYWDGSGPQAISEFCENVGSSQWGCSETMCMGGDADSLENVGRCRQNNGVYDFMWLQATGDNCDAMCFSTTVTSDAGVPVAWPSDCPLDPPSCSNIGYQFNYQMAHLNNVAVDTVASDYSTFTLAHLLISILVTVLVTFIVVGSYFKRKYGSSMYKEIPSTDTF